LLSISLADVAAVGVVNAELICARSVSSQSPLAA